VAKRKSRELMKPFDLVRVKWIDTITYDVWMCLEHFGAPQEDEIMYSVGYFLDTNNKYFSIASMIYKAGDEVTKVNHVTNIPIGCVLEVEILDKK